MSSKNNPPEIPGEVPEIIVTAKRLPSSTNHTPFPFEGFGSAASQLLSQTQDTTQAPDADEGASGSSKPLTPAEIAIRSGLDIKTGELGADLSNLRVEIIRTFPKIVAVWRRLAPEIQRPTITSGRDSDEHLQDSLHYEGLAIDLRVNDIEHDVRIRKAEQIRDALREELGPDYYVDFENPGQDDAHIHIGYRLG